MKLSQYLNNNKAQHLPLEVPGVGQIDDVYFRRLSAGEGLELKDAFADLLDQAGDAVRGLAEGDVEQAEEKARQSLSPDQMRAMFKFQALFCFLHLANKDGSRAYESRKEFDAEVPDEFIQAFYAEGSALKKQDEGEPEKN
jgi:hypothetical protein